MKINQLIIDSNPITTSKFKMTLMERLLFVHLVNRMVDSKVGEISVSILEFGDIVKDVMIDYLGGKQVCDTMKSLMKRIYEVRESGNIKFLFSLFEGFNLDDSGYMRVFLNNRGKLYLGELKEKMTEQVLNLTLSISKIYSKRIFEVIGENMDRYENFFEIGVDELRKRIKIEDQKLYKGWKTFRKEVLEEAKNDISDAGSSIQFEYVLKSKGVVAFKVYNFVYAN